MHFRYSVSSQWACFVSWTYTTCIKQHKWAFMKSNHVQLENCPQLCFKLRPYPNLWPTIPWQLLSWTHAKLQGYSVQKLEWKKLDGRDCITSHDNMVGNHTTSWNWKNVLGGQTLSRAYPWIEMQLVFSARCNIYISRLCYDVSVRLSVTEVQWCIIANLGFKFRSHFTAHCGRRAACGQIISHHASQC